MNEINENQQRGKRLTKAMGTRNITVRQLADSLGISHTAVTHWRKGGSISLEHIIETCKELNISIDWLLTGDKYFFLRGLTNDQQQAVVKLVAALRKGNKKFLNKPINIIE